jgi:sirohydrochlorin cobaltochelatase
MMPPPVEQVLAERICAGARGIGQILIRQNGDGFTLCHRDDEKCQALEIYHRPEDARDLARLTDAGVYRPLKTAPNLRHGWRLELNDLHDLRLALDFFYPGRLPALLAWDENRLRPTPLREALNRQSGMYRVAAKISEGEIDELVGRFCRSRGGEPGCLRTILWPRDQSKARPSLRLPLDKFTAPGDQTGRGENVVPLLCQEACSLLVAEARKVVKGRVAAPR